MSAAGKPRPLGRGGCHGAKTAVMERGFAAGPGRDPDRVAAIDAETAYLQTLPPTRRPLYYLWWNSPGQENNPRWVLEPTAVAAVNRMFTALTTTTSN